MLKERKHSMDSLYKINDYELLSQKVYRVLKTKIVKGILKPQAKLLEGKIAQQLGVSRTPVREAIQKLIAEGFVKKTPNLSLFVIEISPFEYQEVLQVRAILEGLAACLLAKKITEIEIKQLEENIEQTKDSVSANNLLVFADLNFRFHNLIVNNCGNNYLKKILNDLYNKYPQYRMRTLGFAGRLDSALEEHRKILEALKKREEKNVDRLSQEHVKKSLKIFLMNLKKKQSEIL